MILVWRDIKTDRITFIEHTVGLTSKQFLFISADCNFIIWLVSIGWGVAGGGCLCNWWSWAAHQGLGWAKLPPASISRAVGPKRHHHKDPRAEGENVTAEFMISDKKIVIKVMKLFSKHVLNQVQQQQEAVERTVRNGGFQAADLTVTPKSLNRVNQFPFSVYTNLKMYSMWCLIMRIIIYLLLLPKCQHKWKLINVCLFLF